MQSADRKLAWSGVIVLAAIAAELAWFLFVGPPSHARAEQDTIYGSYYYFLPWHWDAAGWTAFFTFALTISTGFLWDATRRTAKIAERTLVDLERPWVFVMPLSGQHNIRDFETGHLTTLSVVFRVKNVGRGPAILNGMVRCRVMVRDDQTNKTIYDVLRIGTPTAFALGPQDSDNVTFDYRVGPLPAGTGRNLAFHFDTRIEYQDASGAPHESQDSWLFVGTAAVEFMRWQEHERHT